MQANLFKRSAVLIEQHPMQCKLYNDILLANGFDVYIARSAMDGLIKIREGKQDLAVINTEIADESFIEKFINKIRNEDKNTTIAIVGLSIYDEEIKKNIAKKIDSFLTKPVSIDRFVESIFKCVEGNVNGS